MISIYSPKARAARSKLREIEANIAHLEQTALKLMRHPDASAAQLWHVHHTLVNVHKSMGEVRALCNEKIQGFTA